MRALALASTFMLVAALVALAPAGQARGGCTIATNAWCPAVVCLSGGGAAGPYRDCIGVVYCDPGPCEFP